ncbi:MAG: protein kinase [Actinomycetales bacterium]|nr:protein kinase [Actinomycetales bacterium]
MNPMQGGVLGNRYELTDRIASGGMGDVWAATDRVLGRTVAVKVMRMLTSDESTFAARFRDEARHTAALAHPNIAAVYDYGEDEGRAFLVMELVPGHPLSSLIATGPLPLEQTRLILGQCALALASAHAAGVVHRDVKPANIMITPEGKVKLTDFGIARAVDAAGHTRTGEVMGTPQYLSPEQAQGQRVTGATDLYSLGVVGYEMLAGTRPFDAGSPVATALAHITETPPPLPDHVTDPLRSAIEACLAKDPAARPSSAASLAALLGMPVAGVSSASLATSVIPLTELGPTAAMPAPFTPAATEIVSPPFPAGHMGQLGGQHGRRRRCGGHPVRGAGGIPGVGAPREAPRRTRLVVAAGAGHPARRGLLCLADERSPGRPEHAAGDRHPHPADRQPAVGDQLRPDDHHDAGQDCHDRRERLCRGECRPRALGPHHHRFRRHRDQGGRLRQGQGHRPRGEPQGPGQSHREDRARGVVRTGADQPCDQHGNDWGDGRLMGEIAEMTDDGRLDPS